MGDKEEIKFSDTPEKLQAEINNLKKLNAELQGKVHWLQNQMDLPMSEEDGLNEDSNDRTPTGSVSEDAGHTPRRPSVKEDAGHTPRKESVKNVTQKTHDDLHLKLNRLQTENANLKIQMEENG